MAKLTDTVEKLVDAAIGLCEPECADDTAQSYTRKTLARRFTNILEGRSALSAPLPDERNTPKDITGEQS